MAFILAIDAGTTNLKAGLVDQRGRTVSPVSRPMKMVRDGAGKAEHSPDALVREAFSACREAVRGRSRAVSAIVLSGYQMGLVALDNRMRALTGISTILDTRPRESFGSLEPHLARQGFYRKTGCPPFTQYQLARLWWMKRTRPGLLRRSRYLLGSKDYLCWKLCGEIATDPSLASATQMMDMKSLEWREDALLMARVTRSQLPPIVDGGRILGRLLPEAAGEAGLPAGIPVIPGVYDGGSLALGLGALDRGVAVLNLGTSAMLRVAVNRPVTDRKGMRLQTYALLPGTWLAGAGLNNAGVAVEWFMKAFGVESHREMERLARQARAGPEVPLVFPFITGERDPRIGSGARGAMFGLRADHGRGALALAALEGVAFSLKLIQDALADNGVRARVVRAGGGGTSLHFWTSLIASVLGLPVEVPHSGNPALTGCGMLGFTALGAYSSLPEAGRAMAGSWKRVAPRHDARLDARFGRFSRTLGQFARSGLFFA